MNIHSTTGDKSEYGDYDTNCDDANMETDANMKTVMMTVSMKAMTLKIILARVIAMRLVTLMLERVMIVK